jgi:hypothetical protein
MSFHLPSGVDSLTSNGGLFSDVGAIRRRQISRIKAYMNGERFDAKKNRAAAFGIPGKPVRLNNVWIRPTGNELSPDKRVYTLSTIDENGDHVGIYLDFTLIDAPTGYIEKREGQYAVKLEPGAVSFNISVSTNAGAY